MRFDFGPHSNVHEFVFTPDKNGLYEFKLVGGGSIASTRAESLQGGGKKAYGGYVTGKITLKKGQNIYVRCGGAGSWDGYSQGGQSGWNNANRSYSYISSIGGLGGGGGMTSISFNSPGGSDITYSNFGGIPPIAVAAGAGGGYEASGSYAGYNGGDLNNSGGYYSTYGETGGRKRNSSTGVDQYIAEGGSGYPQSGESSVNIPLIGTMFAGNSGMNYISTDVLEGSSSVGNKTLAQDSIFGWAEIDLVEEYPDDNKIFIGDKAVPSMYIGDKPVVSAAIGDYKLF